MQYLRIVLIILCAYFKGFSQISDTLLSTYKNQDLRLRKLEFGGFLTGGNGSYKNELLYRIDGAVKYSNSINRIKLQSEFQSGISFNHSKERGYNSSDNPFDQRTDLHLNSFRKSRDYSKSKLFFGYGYKFLYSYDYSHKKDYLDPIKIVNEITHNLNIEVPLSIGTGRIYPVHSLNKSMWIYSELQKNHCLKREFIDHDLEQLAHLIDNEEYTRFFDYRDKRIRDLSRIDSVLQSQDIVTVHDINYYTTMNDMYYFSPGTYRYRGKILEGGIIGEYYYNEDKLTDTGMGSDIKYMAVTPVFFVEFQRFKPIDLHWQFDYGIHVEYGLNSLFNNKNKLYGSKDDRINIEALASLNFYPNTRTELNLSLSTRYGNKIIREFYSPYLVFNSIYNLYPYQYEYSFPYVYHNGIFINPANGINYSAESKFWSELLTLTHFYYISPQFRTQTYFSLSYFTDKNTFSNYNNKLRANFSISFAYALF